MTDTVVRAQASVEGAARELRSTLNRVRGEANSPVKSLYVQSLERAIDALDGAVGCLKTADKMGVRYGDV